MSRPILERLGTGRIGTALTASALVARRRARHDAPQLVMTASLVAVTTFLAIAGPGIMFSTLDEGARDAVARAGSSVDVIARFGVGDPAPGAANATPKGAITMAESMPDALPPAIFSVFDGQTLTVITDPTAIREVDGRTIEAESQFMARVAMLTPQNTEGLAISEGRLPGARADDSRAPIELVISEETAAATDLAVGSVVNLRTPPTEEELAEELLDPSDEPSPITEFEIVGIAGSDGPVDEDLWQDIPEFWHTEVHAAAGSAPERLHFTGLVSPDGMSATGRFLDTPLAGSVRLRVDASRFTYEVAIAAAAEAKALVSNGQVLGGDSLAEVSAQAELHRALANYPAQVRAALAQMSLMMAGVLGIAAVVLVLLARLLLNQRAAAIALERARGASVLSIGLRSLLESLVVTAVGCAVGIGAAILLAPGGLRDPLPVVAVGLVALLAGPVLAMALARAMWTGRRDPANRRDRQLLARKRRMQRLVIECAVVALAAAAIVSIRGRGLLQTRSEGIDPLLVAAPLLLAIAVTIVVIRVYPYPVRAIGALAQRTRGVLGLLGSVRARSAVAALPLLALALGASLTIMGAMLVDTVRNGQDEAAWQRVGADARVDAELTPDQVDELRAAPGVETVSATRSRGGVSLNLGTTTTAVTVIGIDEDYADVIDALPGQPDAGSLRGLAEASTDGRLAMVVDQATADQLLREDIAMYFGPAYIQLEIIGTSAVSPDGYVDGPFAFVDRESLVALLPDPQSANRYLVMGDGAAAAVSALDVEDGAALTWDGWLEERRGFALVAGVESAMLFAVIAVALLSVVALVSTVIGGARARGRALSMLRTLGMSSRLGWWLALAELGPLILASILGGIVAGVIVMVTLTPAIGLDVLAGGTTVPTTSLSPNVFIALALAGAVLLALGSLADVLVHRRDKLSEVLRVGETV